MNMEDNLNEKERKELELHRECNAFIVQLEMLVAEVADLELWRANNELEEESSVDKRLAAIKKMNANLREFKQPIKDCDVFLSRRGLLSNKQDQSLNYLRT